MNSWGAKIRTIRTRVLVRLFLALFVAPALPFLLITLPVITYMDSNAQKGSAGLMEPVMLLGSLLAFPVTWVVFLPLYGLFTRNNITSMFAYVVTGAMLGLLLSAIFPPAALVGVPFGALVGAGAYCSLRLFLNEERTPPDAQDL